MQGKVEICGVNTAKLKVLKSEESLELLRRARAGDMQAREELISGNLRLVTYYAFSAQLNSESPRYEYEFEVVLDPVPDRKSVV